MLLLDDKPYKLSDEDTITYGKNLTYLIPQSKVSRNAVTKRLEVPQGIGIPCTFRFINKDGKESTLRYFDHSYYDEGLKREIYTPEQLLIDNTGRMIVSKTDAEKNFFLNMHPGLDEGVSRKHYPRYPIIFRIKDKPKENIARMEDFKLKRELEAYIDPASSKSWDFEQLVAMCQVLASDNDPNSRPYNLVLPDEVLGYGEIEAMDAAEKKRYEPVLRVALLDVINKWPQYAKDRMHVSMDREVMTTINKAMKDPTFRFNPSNNTWEEQVDTKWLPLLKCQPNQDAKERLLKEMKVDPKLNDKVSKHTV